MLDCTLNFFYTQYMSTTLITKKNGRGSKIKIGLHRQITIPTNTMKRLGLVAGVELDVVEHKKAIILVPRTSIPNDQRWYHTKTWQKMMRGAFEDLKRGRVAGPFDGVEELLKELHS